MPLPPIEFPQAPTLTSPFSEQGFSLSLCLACFAESDAALLEMEAFLKLVVNAASFGWWQPRVQQTAFAEIVGSGKLGLIRNVRLR